MFRQLTRWVRNYLDAVWFHWCLDREGLSFRIRGMSITDDSITFDVSANIVQFEELKLNILERNNILGVNRSPKRQGTVEEWGNLIDRAEMELRDYDTLYPVDERITSSASEDLYYSGWDYTQSVSNSEGVSFLTMDDFVHAILERSGGRWNGRTISCTTYSEESGRVNMMVNII